MKGKLISMMKRWWLVAFVFALALTLTSCSRKKNNNLAQHGWAQCQGDLGDFDVWVVRSQAKPGTYDVFVIPVAVTNPGDIVTVWAASSNASVPNWKPLVQQTALHSDLEIPAGSLTEGELQQFDYLAITLFDPQNSFMDTQGEDTVCSLPYPDGTNSY